MFTQGRIRVILLFAADAFCMASIWAAVVLGYRLVGFGRYDPAVYLDFWPAILLFLSFNAIFDNYNGSWMYPSAPLSPVEELRRLSGSAMLTHLAVIAFLGFAYQTTEGYSRFVIAVSGVLVAVGAQSFRNWARRMMRASGIGQIPVVLSGGGESARRVLSALADDSYFGFKVVGYFNGTGRVGRKRRRREWGAREFEDAGIKYLGSLRDIVSESRKRDIKILLACQDERLFRLQMDEFAGWFTYIDYLPTARAFPIFGSRAISFDGIGGLEMTNQGRMKVKRLQKRVLDAVFAAVAFAVLSPLFVLIPLLIKLTSRGPVFYFQTRLGRNGKKFRVCKFRSMYADADARLDRLLARGGAIAEEWRRSFKLKNDPRVTALGKFLRKTSLDELPQLFNVFSGDMALIGPRPIVDEEVAYYGDAYKVVSSVRPGITGLWQVSGRSDTQYDRRVALDTYYVLNWSPWMDVWVLLRTFYAVVFMRGAR